MNFKNSLILVLVCAVLAGAVLSASAITTFSLDRSSNIDVVADDSGILALNPGSSSFVALNNGQLSIDATNGGRTA